MDYCVLKLQGITRDCFVVISDYSVIIMAYRVIIMYYTSNSTNHNGVQCNNQACNPVLCFSHKKIYCSVAMHWPILPEQDRYKWMGSYAKVWSEYNVGALYMSTVFGCDNWAIIWRWCPWAWIITYLVMYFTGNWWIIELVVLDYRVVIRSWIIGWISLSRASMRNLGTLHVWWETLYVF